jgi:hypothetical protein
MNTQKENFGLVGRTWIKKVTDQNPEGELVDYVEKNLLADGSALNAIFPGMGTTSPTGLKAYLAESMSSVIDRALNNLFTAHTNGPGENGKDGIVVMDELGQYNNASGTVWTMVTTTMITTTPFARKWKGTATVSGSPKQWSAAALGWNWTGNGAPDVFTTTYATQSFTTVTLGVGESLVIEWEIAIA